MTQIREEVYFTKGRVIVRGKTVNAARPRRPTTPLLQAEHAARRRRSQGQQPLRRRRHAAGARVRRDSRRAVRLQLQRRRFLEHDRTGARGTVEREIPLDQFPSPDELWARYCEAKGYTPKQEAVATQDYYDDGTGKSPRYYQLIAINRTVEAIARGENRILLVMATGTGKTYTAFQIIWRLWKAGAKKRILFLVDRNILVDQTKTNDFKPFGQAMTKITNRTVDKAFEIYLCLYQAVTGTEEEQNIYKQFSPDFFDLVVVDECHRGSAAEDAAWREMLDYFSSATQIGLTATPKETKDVSNIEYFGEPIYTYSLTQGIEDGFLAPYKVVRIDLDKDLDGWRPEKGKTDKYGQVIEDRDYNERDFDRNLVLEKRTELVAAKDHRVPQSHRPLRQDDRLLRGHRPRRAHAPGAGQRQPRPRRRQQQVRHAHHRRQRRGQGAARQLHRSRSDLPGHRHHVAADDDRRGCADLPADRARPAHRVDDRVQADHRPRHAHQRGLRQALLHHHGLQAGDRAVCRPGLRRRSGPDLRAEADEPPVPPDEPTDVHRGPQASW